MMKPVLTTTFCELKRVLGSPCLTSPQLWVAPHLCQAYVDIVDDSSSTTESYAHFLNSAKLCVLYDTFNKLKSPFVDRLAVTSPTEDTYSFITYVVLDALTQDTHPPYTLEIRHLSTAERRACIVAYFIYSYSYAQEFGKPFMYILNEYDPADTTIALIHRDAFRLDQLLYPTTSGALDTTPLLSAPTLTPPPMNMSLTVPLALAQHIDAVAPDTLAYLSSLCALPVHPTHLSTVASVDAGVESAARVPVPRLRRDWQLPYAYTSTLGITTTEMAHTTGLSTRANCAGAASGAVTLSPRWIVDTAAHTASGYFPYHVLFRNGVLYVESPVLEAIASYYLARTQARANAGAVSTGTIQPAAVCRRWLRDGLTHHVTMGHMYIVQSQAAMDALHEWLATKPLQLRVEGLGSVCDRNLTATSGGLKENRAHYVVLSCAAYGQHYKDTVGTRICLHMTVAFTENDIHNQAKDETTILMK